MPIFTVRKQVDAYVSYYSEVEADTAEEAVDSAYGNSDEYEWEFGAVSEFDATRVTAVDGNFCEVGDYARGKA